MWVLDTLLTPVSAIFFLFLPCDRAMDLKGQPHSLTLAHLSTGKQTNVKQDDTLGKISMMKAVRRRLK